MIKFVDLKTGNVFDGSYPYVFWFDNEQSINIKYIKPICFISDVNKIEVSINQNDIFKLIDPSRLQNSNFENIYGFEYHNISNIIAEGNSLVLEGTPHHNYYVYIFYIMGSTDFAGEYKESFYIDGESFKVGADFYDGEESLYINMANKGVEIPESIQKALYNINIHEDKRDNILLNRKWKELLSNYWDIIANKGSYKSLINSLKWFEYGDLIRICEVWKKNDCGDRYEVKDMRSFLGDMYTKTVSNFSKTTYISLYCALEGIKYEDDMIKYDDEKNPILENISFKWSIQDLSLKLCLLGNFFETYFMPIHLDLIHHTIEDIVYTNSIKNINGTLCNRKDIIYNTDDIKCNVKDGDIYRLSPVKCYVGPDTLFKSNVTENQSIITGVQRAQVIGEMGNDEKINYLSQMYNSIGAIIDFDIHIPLHDDFIKREVLMFKTYNDKQQYSWEVREDYKIIKDGNIKFSLLCRFEGEYEVRLQFESVSGQVYTKYVKFNVLDTEHVGLKVYKIKNIGCPLLYKDKPKHPWGNTKVIDSNDYVFSRYLNGDEQYKIYTQYIPAKNTNPYNDDIYWDGVCLNHLFILEGDATDQPYMYKNYFMLKREVVYKNLDNNDLLEDKKIYTICISRSFGFIYDDKLLDNESYSYCGYPIYKNEYTYIPEFHTMVELGSDKGSHPESIKYYTISNDDALCIIPELSYGKYINDYEYELYNATTQKYIKIDRSIKEPFISDSDYKFLDPGYYNIIFKYRLTGENKINKICLESAFLKK